MKKSLLVLTAILFISADWAFGQINVGSDAPPDASVALQVSSPNLGFMPPKVSIADTKVFGLSGDSKTPGILVYNTNKDLVSNGTYASFGAGIYLWNGAGWVWQGVKPSFYASGSTIYDIPVGASLDLPVNVGTVNTVVGDPLLMPTVSNGGLVAGASGKYKINLSGYINPAQGSSGSVAIQIKKNGAYFTQFSIYVDGNINIVNLLSFTGYITLEADDVLTFSVIRNTTGAVINNLYLKDIEFDLLRKL